MALQRQVEQVLPSALRRGCRAIKLERQTLTLAANNGAIAAKLRQMGAEIAASLQALGREVTVIQVQVQVSAPPFVPPPQPRTLSPRGKNQLREFADDLSDSPLKDALKRLSAKN